MDLFNGITYYKRRKVASSSSPRNTSLDDLKEDELINVFIRVPLDSIHRFKCVSKYWLTIISEPSFIHSYIRHHLDSRRCNDFIVWQTKRVKLHFGQVTLNPLLEKSSTRSCNHDQQGKLFSDNIDFTYSPPKRMEGLFIHGVSHGLLLCEDFRPRKLTAHEYVGRSYKRGRYYVCNPLTKQWLIIPQKHDWVFNGKRPIVGFMCYALDSNLPCKAEFTIFEALPKKIEHGFFYTHIFTLKTSCWTIHCVTCPLDLSWEPTLNVVVYKGKFHWKAGEWIVAYDPLNRPCKCSLISIPHEAAEQRQQSYICLSEGHIRMVSCASTGKVYCLYEITDYEKDEWCMKYRVNISDYFQDKVFISSFISSPTNGKTVWVKYLVKGHTMMLALLDMESISVLSIVELPKYGCVFRNLVYVMPSWPTIIPQLKVCSFDQEGEESSIVSDDELHSKDTINLED